jgi:hypothetical protein
MAHERNFAFIVLHAPRACHFPAIVPADYIVQDVELKIQTTKKLHPTV